MQLRLVALKKQKSGAHVARKVIPADVRDAYARVFKKRWEEKLHLPRGTSVADAKLRYGDWCAEIETRIANLRVEVSGNGRTLSHKEAYALAGEWYSWFVAKHEDAPGQPRRWRQLSDHVFWDVILAEAPQSFIADRQSDPDWAWKDAPEVRAKLRPVIVEAAQTALFLATRSVVLSERSLAAFLDAVEDEFSTALEVLERRAGGDYTPDDTPKRFPKFTQEITQMSPWTLFEAWVKAKQPASATVQRWRGVVRALEKMHSDVGAIGVADARTWTQGLVTERRSAKTVREVWLPAVRTVFGFGVTQGHLSSSPFTGISVTVPRRARTRETLAFTDAEAQKILKAASAIASPRRTFEGAKRWVFWLTAYTGARAGEITQLRGIDIEKREASFFAKLSPDAGTIKTREMRLVPLHEHLIEQGFIEFVQTRGKGPLFYNVDRSVTEVDVFNPKAGRAVKTRQRLGGWVRALGVNDPELSPTHAWRHTFKARAARAGMSERMSDFITGHAPATMGRQYGAPTAEDMADAMKGFPRYVV